MLTNNEIIIGKTLPNEITECYQMMQKLAEYEGENLDSILSEKEFVELTSPEKPIFHILTAKKENKIVGIAIYYYRYSTWKGKHIHLEDLFVDSEYRKFGIGKKLFDELIDTAKREKLKRVEWEVHSVNEKAINFYKKLGAEITDDWKICRLELK